MAQVRGKERRILRGEERKAAVRELAGHFVDGARFFDALAAMQAAEAAAKDALTAICRVPHPEGESPFGLTAAGEIAMAQQQLGRTLLLMAPRTTRTLGAMGWTHGPIESDETWFQRWMTIATKPSALGAGWPEAVAREAAALGAAWLLKHEGRDTSWVKYADGCREPIADAVARGAGAMPRTKWMCRHRERAAKFYHSWSPPLRPATAIALRDASGSPEKMKKRAQRARKAASAR